MLHKIQNGINFNLAQNMLNNGSQKLMFNFKTI